MVRYFVTVAVLCVGNLASAAEPQRWALLIGVDDYNTFADLKFAGSDAAALAGALKESGFDEARRVLLHDKSTENRYRPFKANIDKQIDLILSLAGPDDLVVVGFFGHGLHLDGTSYLCPADADETRPNETLISVDGVYKKFGECQAALKLLVVDACRNDPRPAGKRSATPDVDLKSLGATFDRPPDGLCVLASCSPGQVSWEDTEFGHGVFTKYLLKGLAGDADGNKNGRVTLSELYDYTSDETKAYVLKRFTDKQIPALKGEINGVFEFPRSGLASQFTNSIGIKLTLIPAGEFMMGSLPEKTRRGPFEIEVGEKNEQPQHRVRITRPFYMGVHEVTQKQWQAVMGTTPWEGGNQNFVMIGPDYPAGYFTWDDAKEFCRRLSTKEGKQYDLPTEAQWEYACRAGTTTKWSFGEDVGQLNDYAWSGDTIMNPEIVGTKRPNPWGLFDMHGNVAEWCKDWYDDAYYGSSPVDDPENSNKTQNHVCRGGSYFTWDLLHTRSAGRRSKNPDQVGHYIGFRVVLIP